MTLNIKEIFSAYLKTSLYLLALFFVGWGFTEQQPLFLGLIVGTIAAIYSMWLLSRKIQQFAEAVIHSKKATSLGVFSRIAAAILAVFLALYFEEHIQLFGVVLGLVASYVVITINFLLLQKKESRAGKRGE